MSARRGIEIALLNPNRYAEAAARRLRPWLAEMVAALVAALVGEEGPVAALPRNQPAAAPPRSLGVRFTGDRAMRRANREFRGKDQTTDVLSFPGGGVAGGAEDGGGAVGGPEVSGGAEDGGHLGDILVSVPQARRQAAAAGGDPAREVQVLLLHGVLHCLGYDHESDGGQMERLERQLRRRWIGAAGAPGAPAAAAAAGPRGPRGHRRRRGAARDAG